MNYIIKIRNFLIEIAKLLIPVISIILVYFLNLSPLTYIVNLFGIRNELTNVIAPSAEAGFVATLISVATSLLIKSISLKNTFSIELYDNYMEDKLILPLAAGQSDHGNKKYKLYLKAKIKYNDLNIKKAIEYKDDLIIKIVFPTWISYEIENAYDLGEGVVTERTKNEFQVNVSNYIGKNQFKGNLIVKMELVSNSLETRCDGQVIASYNLIPKVEASSIYEKLKSFFYKVVQIIFIFFKINIKNVDKDISTS